MVEQIVDFILGFVLCGLLGLAFLPLVSRRARRLTLARIEDRLPMTFDEIEAERDLLRARFAVENRALEIKAEEARREHAADAAELGRQAIAVTRANEQLEQTTALLNDRNAQLAKSLEFGEKTLAELTETRERLSARESELVQKTGEYDELAEAHRKLDNRANELEAALTAAKADLRDVRERLDATEAKRREFLTRAEQLAEQNKTLSAALEEAQGRAADFETRRTRLLAKIAAERQRGDELESANLGLRRALAQTNRLDDDHAVAAEGGEAAANNGADMPFSPAQELLDLREAISRIGRHVARLDAERE